MKKSLRAFSLIELSIVLTVIGILIGGIVAGSSLLKSARLSTAQRLTQNSPVAQMPNLVVWYETSLPSSFSIGNKLLKDGDLVGTWYNNNPSANTYFWNNTIESATNKNDAIQALIAKQPRFYKNVFNGAIPSLRFDGVDDFLNFDGLPLVGSAYTIFVVEQGVFNKAKNYFLGGNTSSQNQNLILGAATTNTLTQSHFTNDLSFTFSNTNKVSRIHSFSFNLSTGKSYSLNATLQVPSFSNPSNSALTSYFGSSISCTIDANSFFRGDLAEVIIFNRSLKTNEKALVEKYLSQKFGVSTS